MKRHFLLSLVVLSAAACRSASTLSSPGATPTETKVQLMGQALEARDAGDWDTAEARLNALLAVSPEDAEVKRLLADVEKSKNAPPPTPVPSSEAAPRVPAGFTVPRSPVVSGGPPPSETVVEPSPSISATTPPPAPATSTSDFPQVIVETPPDTPPPPPPDPRTQARERVENTGAAFAQAPTTSRTNQLMPYIQAQMDLAQQYADDGNYLTAASIIDEALTSIGYTVDELRDKRAQYIRQELRARQGVRLLHHR